MVIIGGITAFSLRVIRDLAMRYDHEKKRYVPRPLKTIDDILEKGTVVDFKFTPIKEVNVEGRAVIKGYDAKVDLHPFELYRKGR